MHEKVGRREMRTMTGISTGTIVRVQSIVPYGN